MVFHIICHQEYANQNNEIPLLYLLEWLKSGTLTIPNAGKEVEQQNFSYIGSENAKCYSHLEDTLVVSTELNILLPYRSSIMLFSIYPKVLKTSVHKKTCPWMFTAALFITAKTWKQPRYSIRYYNDGYMSPSICPNP